MIKKHLNSLLSAALLWVSSHAVADTQWRTLSPDNLMVMTLPHGKVIFELAPQFAPRHVAHFKALAANGHYQDNKFYRVIDGFVAQAGPAESEQAYGDNLGHEQTASTISMESEWLLAQSPRITPVQSPDLFAKQTGFSGGFAVASDDTENKAWLTHCPGVLALARGNEPDSGTSHFYITNGQAPRYLDRIMTIFGRVVYGMNHVQAITRTAVIEGQAAVDNADFTPIVSMALMSSLPIDEQITIQVEDTESAAFVKKLVERRARSHAFFYKKPPSVLDVCQVPVVSRIVPTNADKPNKS
ncbi:peptidylprolyl isomerase [Thalassotalea euphylliae]|uniref:peptidylprolyl isomerase n=1 Tax=Thalassotalea euphylliae TaxID=1655234 RepID=A0A3E0TLJ1_9GAMM|nr:peptidylprolyl isomerase [Thalassotalea euphylliae]REL25140.1 peptidylprolyl isomerase [Thalassotalea euphylliae]